MQSKFWTKTSFFSFNLSLSNLSFLFFSLLCFALLFSSSFLPFFLSSFSHPPSPRLKKRRVGQQDRTALTDVMNGTYTHNHIHTQSHTHNPHAQLITFSLFFPFPFPSSFLLLPFLGVEVMKELRHENIIGLHEVIDDDTCSLLFLVLHLMEYGPIVDPKVGREEKKRGRKKNLVGWAPSSLRFLIFLFLFPSLSFSFSHQYYRKEMGEWIEEETVRKYFRDVVIGLKYLHSHHICHRFVGVVVVIGYVAGCGVGDIVFFLLNNHYQKKRDIKPANLLVDKHHVCHISDFGIAFRFEGDDDRLSNSAGISLSLSLLLPPLIPPLPSSLLGTPSFLSPELCKVDGNPRGCPADIWALGVSLYYLIFADLPFSGNSLAELYDEICQKEVWRGRGREGEGGEERGKGWRKKMGGGRSRRRKG